MEDLISIIIPVYNTHQYLEACINSVNNQTYANVEVIVVDDGSNQKTKNKIQELSTKIDVLLTQENSGQSTARNLGIENAKGNYIVVLDSDDYFESTFCEKALKKIKQNNEVKIVTCRANIIFNNKIKDIFIPKGGDLSKMIIKNTAMGSCMFKRKDWQYVTGYDEKMRKGFEDWEFYIRLLKNGGYVFVIDEVLFNYRRHTLSTTTKANKIKYDLLKYIYLKHEDLYKLYFKDLVDFLLNKIELEEAQKIKIYNKIDYKIGSFILKPLRFIKK
ncbi:glycosyltransferase [Polaribacter batillariae]|uniref:Glycosyltransferase n=1 Tax=Polaribacter batillariae TaxID=2808900 RepID=A0ABX7SXK1_9FLAO|nr:glycosyltransferase [Polaribacter batillariae]QTD37559.1 glycosyltransferase [Polaribacter batillariae]